MKNTGLFLIALAVAACGAAGGAEWYAEVETTGGDFTIKLDWEGAPKGCAAFAALAEGVADWVNPQTGRVEKGTEFFPGTALGWVQGNEEGTPLLLGNRGRMFRREDGTTNFINGSGLTLADDIRDGGGRGLSARSVAMVNAGGPDTLDGRWAVFLADGEPYYGGEWSRIGTVASNWSVVTNIAGGTRDAATAMLVEPATVTGVRVWSEPPEALEAWRAAATNWPRCGHGDVAVEVSGTNGTLRCGWKPKSQYAVTHCGDLTSGTAESLWMDWNEGEEEAWSALSFAAGETKSGGMWFGARHFFSVAEVEYPELGGPVVSGGEYGLLTEWQWGDGTVERYLHELDWDTGRGEVWEETAEGTWTNFASAGSLDQYRAGWHSREVLLACPMWLGMWPMYLVYHYQLGETDNDGRGRFRLELHPYVYDSGSGSYRETEQFPPIEVWGDYRWVKVADILGEGERSRGTAGGGRGRAAKMFDAGMVPGWRTPWVRRGEAERFAGGKTK